MSLTESRREKRMMMDPTAEILDERTYNLALGGTVMYGLILNIVMCATLGNRMAYVNPLMLIIGYFISCIVGVLLSSKSDNPVISFIGYNLIVVPVGLVLSITISSYVRAGAGDIVFQAVVYTTVTTAVMIALSIMFPDFFAKIGGLIFGALIGLVIAELLALFFFPGAQNGLAWAGAGVFSLYIGYDYYRAQQYPKTLDNAIDSAVDIYLDIINLFLRILRILGSKGGSSRRR
jgi:FtsH-binding integral membrane protein